MHIKDISNAYIVVSEGESLIIYLCIRLLEVAANLLKICSLFFKGFFPLCLILGNSNALTCSSLIFSFEQFNSFNEFFISDTVFFIIYICHFCKFDFFFNTFYISLHNQSIFLYASEHMDIGLINVLIPLSIHPIISSLLL